MVSGSILGRFLAYAFLRGDIWASPEGLPRLHEIALNGTSLLFAMGLAMCCSVFIAIIPLAKFVFAEKRQDFVKEDER